MADANPIKLCECGCGRPTNIAKWTNKKYGHVRGQPIRFIVGHGSKASIRRPGHRVQGNKNQTYRIWARMIQRCTNPKNKNWQQYGARGITVCERWRTYANFLADMGERPHGLTIERVNNDGQYEPTNCIWADRATQINNRRNTVRLTYDGQTLLLSEWATKLGVRYATLAARLRHGWPLKKLLTPNRFDSKSRPIEPVA
jgi:hypothetical protein